MKKILVLFFLFQAASLQAASLFEQLEAKGAKDYWLRLLHYKKSFGGGYKSLVDGPLFFISPEGKKNPEKELEATIEALSDPARVGGWGKLPLACVFVERVRFLKEVGLLKTPKVHCPDFQQWRDGIKAESVSLIFSSSYPNNPASMFGHTFLRFNQKGKSSDLLDYAASFSADVPENELSPVYAAKGIFGGYRGFFSLNVYYQKVNEYNHQESRDLYEYEMNIPPKMVGQLVNHLWELYASTYFDYYFFDENCSFVLGAFLELANSDWDFTSDTRWYFLPADLVKRVSLEAKAVRKVSYRPSMKKELQRKIEGLNSEERKEFEKIDDTQDPSVSKNWKALEAHMAFMEFKKVKNKGKLPKDKDLFYRKLLLARAKLQTPGKDDPHPFSQNNRPELSHEPAKIILSSEHIKNDFRHELKVKLGYHDLLASDKGMEPFSKFDFLEAAIIYDQGEKKWDYSYLSFAHVNSLHNFTFYDPQLSWMAGTQVDIADELECRLCHRYRAYGGGGLSFELGVPWAVTYFMLGGLGEASDHYDKGFRIGPYFETSLLVNTFKNDKLQLLGRISTDIKRKWDEEYRSLMSFSYSFNFRRNWDLRLHSSHISRIGSFAKRTLSYKLELGHFF